MGYRFSNKGWWGYPLMADAYAHWVREAWGDFVLLAWDYETFGEHHSKDTGIFDFMRTPAGGALPARGEDAQAQ